MPAPPGENLRALLPALNAVLAQRAQDSTVALQEAENQRRRLQDALIEDCRLFADPDTLRRQRQAILDLAETADAAREIAKIARINPENVREHAEKLRKNREKLDCAQREAQNGERLAFGVKTVLGILADDRLSEPEAARRLDIRPEQVRRRREQIQNILRFLSTPEAGRHD